MKPFPAALLALGTIAGWRMADACAPDFFRAVFSYVRHPDLPRTAFIDGRLGVLQPTFARSYLVIAYRYLDGIGMSPREREQARDFYKDRDTSPWDHIGADWPQQWQITRAGIQPPPAPPIPLITGGQLAYDPETHSFALNCAEDAYRIALHTLEARRARFGVASPAFRSWLGAQDVVFRNCSSRTAEMPPEASPELPPLIRADRAYQMAAAHFYAGHYPAALDRFRRIGQDPSSPWNSISRYLVVRTLLRMTEIPKGAPEVDAQLTIEAQAILADPKLSSIHGMTWNLVERANLRQRDQSYFRDLAHLLSARDQGDGLREELWNYTGMYDHVIGQADPNLLYRPAKPVPADAAQLRNPDLTDWIFHFQSRDRGAFAHCLRRWQQTHSPPWLLAALGHADAATAKASGLLDAAGAVPDESPAYLTARFHLLRMSLELGDRTAAREGLDDLLASAALQGLPSSTNLFRGVRMMVAPDLSDFLQFAGRKPVMITMQDNWGETPGFLYDQESKDRPKAVELLDGDATRVLNGEMPFRLLKETALGNQLPKDVRSEALVVAFTRGLMLGQDLDEIATALGMATPSLAPLVDAYRNATEDEDKRFAAAFLLLHRPEARPYFAPGITRPSHPGQLDRYRDNWWCPMDIEIDFHSLAQYRWNWETPNLLQRSTDIMPEFLAGDTVTEAEQEFTRLGKLSAGADFLASIVLPFAESHPRDPRVPEALYWLIRAGQYGCADTNTWKTTRAAFGRLQGTYPNTNWAKRTPSWIKNDYSIRQEIKDRQSRN